MRASSILGFAVATYCAACGGCRATNAPSANARAEWRYEVDVAPDAQVLTVDATFVSSDTKALALDDDAMRFVQGIERRDEHVRYRFALGDAARALRDSDGAIAFDGAIIAPASTWLLHPSGATPSSYRIHFRGAASVLSPIPNAADGASNSYEAKDVGLDDSPYFGFGAWRRRTSKVLDSELTIGIAASVHGVADDDVVRFVTDASTAVARYLGGFVRPSALVLVVPGNDHGIDGRTMGGGGGSVIFALGPDVTAENARSNWVVAHELVHLNLPSFGFPHKWLEEGIATYVEPIARARVGALATEQVWRDLVEGIPKGMPMAGDEGLEKTHTWGRTYWGGALFCLVADVEIRKQSGNAHSFDDVLRAMVASGASAAQRWQMERVFATAERATGTTVIRDQFARLALAPGKVDIDAIWRDLGVSVVNGAAVFDDRAPLAAIRRAITAP